LVLAITHQEEKNSKQVIMREWTRKMQETHLDKSFIQSVM
jgi:hypothetical protein